MASNSTLNSSTNSSSEDPFVRKSELANLEDAIQYAYEGADLNWILMSGVVVFFMQTGFAFVESGSVREKNYMNVLLKNLIDACCGAMVWFFWGFGLAYGNVNGGFMGTKYFAGLGLEEEGQYGNWFFQYAFACSAATIVSGSVAERISINAYVIFSIWMTGVIYPIVVAWTWGQGWLYEAGFTDFAGSGIVHLTGGVSGLVAAIIVGPRLGKFRSIRENVDATNFDFRFGRFQESGLDASGYHKRFKESGYDIVIDKYFKRDWDIARVHNFSRQYRLKLTDRKFMPHNNLSLLLGTLINWFTWLMFNGGSSLGIISEKSHDQAQISMVNTIMAPAAAGLTTFYFKKYIVRGDLMDLRMDFGGLCNGV
mmetsp:Transcript_40684/g.62060  ORF Transcript_40684/g.62060 Transcript_40684/m.62060 type:complete len:368 (+) Transcript_40684:40-1143(+)